MRTGNTLWGKVKGGERSGFRGGAARGLCALVRLCVGDAIDLRFDNAAVVGVLFFLGGEPAGGSAFFGPAMGLLTVPSERRDIFLTFDSLRYRLRSGGVYHSFSSLSWQQTFLVCYKNKAQSSL